MGNPLVPWGSHIFTHFLTEFVHADFALRVLWICVFVDFLSTKDTKRQDYLTYAKVEFGSDWQYAYDYMLAHDGKAPR